MSDGRRVAISVDLDSPSFASVMESLLEKAYAAGFAKGLTQEGLSAGERTSVVEAYEDWRAFGPGLLLPGGRYAVDRIMSRRHVEKAKEEKTDG